jgi:tRNA threonylcarbamoyladenosine biosynthesis protein TsaB
VSAADQILLAIDTSTEVTGLALYDGEQVSEVTWHGGRNQTASLLNEIRHLLTLNQCTTGDLQAVAVATGPGTFNGLRVGLSTAKALGYGLGIPIVGVVTLDAVAYPHMHTRLPIRAFVSAGRGRTVFADFRQRNDRWERLSDLRNDRLDRIADGLVERTILAGELSREVEETLARKPLAIIPSPALRVQRPSYLAEIAYQRWQAGEVDQIESLEPIYVHGPVSPMKPPKQLV